MSTSQAIERSLRIAHVVPVLAEGGVARILLEHCTRTIDAGHDVLVVSSGGVWEQRIAATGAAFARVPGLSRLPRTILPATLGTTQALRAFAPDIVHSHAPATALIAAGAAALCRVRPPHISTAHGIPPDQASVAIACFRRSGAHIVGCAPSVTAQLIAGGVPADRVETVTNGASLVPASAEHVAAARARLGLPVGRPLILGLGRLVAQKDWPTFIAAVDLVPGANAVIVGEGPQRTELAELIRRRGSRVTMPGSAENVAAVFGAADVFLMTSHWEGAPMTGLEALSLGMPTVSVDMPGLGGIVPSNCFITTPSRHPETIAKALRALLADAEGAHALRTAALAAARAWSPEAMSEAYLAVYRREIGRCGTSTDVNAAAQGYAPRPGNQKTGLV